MSIYILGTLDTKGAEVGFVRDRIKELGVDTTVVDTGCINKPTIKADISREVFFEIGGYKLADLVKKNDRGAAVAASTNAAVKLLTQAHAEGKVSGVLALGGSAGTTIATAAMQALPIGVPKVMVSTLASGDVRKFVGDKDIMMINSIVDILGLNRVSRAVLGNAAHAAAGMAKFAIDITSNEDKPLIAATMFGVTTLCVNHAKEILEKAGYEVLIFHATGNGGQAMETLIRDGMIAGVLDATTTELADEHAGGFLTAGPDRLKAAGEAGIPQVISVGATDMANFWGMESVPEQFKGRNLYVHNPTVTLMRTTKEDCEKIGRDIGAKAARAKGPTVIYLPSKGVSAIDADDMPFNDPEARQALYDNIKATAGDTSIVEMDNHINDEAFAEAMANRLIEMLQGAAVA